METPAPTSSPPAGRLLIVDDEIPQMTALCRTLRDEGYDTTGFGNPHDALAALRTQRFEIILTDLHMPQMDGIALLRAAHEIDPDLVGIVMTGQGAISTAVEAMKTGALDYVLKPFKLSAIIPVLNRALIVRDLRVKNAELEQRVKDRTSELEAANRELESFSYSVSHDLRSPLRGIGHFADFLIQQHHASLPEDSRRYLTLIADSVQKMEALIAGLLSLAQATRHPLSKHPLSLSSLATEVIDELRKIENRPAEIRIAQVPDCLGDRTLLKQVLANLLSNALKFTRRTEGALVEFGAFEQSGERVFFVRDNGAGFDMQYAGKLFGSFQRLHRADEFEGTGVGLSTVQRIIHRHGGRIWAEGAVGKGATFYFTIPA